MGREDEEKRREYISIEVMFGSRYSLRMIKAKCLESRLIDYSVIAINVTESLSNSKAGNHIAGQLIRSGNSPAPNYGEAQSAESRKDFVHKMKIALKELRETIVWLKIIERKALCNNKEVADAVKECDELISIFVASVKTAEHKGN